MLIEYFSAMKAPALGKQHNKNANNNNSNIGF